MTNRDTTVVLAQCTGAKRDGTHAARNLYDESDYFVKQRDYAEAVGDVWFILSAKHGLVSPDETVDSYDMHAKEIDDTEAWGAAIADRLDQCIPDSATVKILGGRRYADPVVPELESRGYEVHEPLRGQGIGERKKSLIQMANETLGGFA